MPLSPEDSQRALVLELHGLDVELDVMKKSPVVALAGLAQVVAVREEVLERMATPDVAS